MKCEDEEPAVKFAIYARPLMCNGFKYLRFFSFFEGPRFKSGTAKTIPAVLLGPALLLVITHALKLPAKCFHTKAVRHACNCIALSLEM